ncbi:MAG TPA: DUF4230 domain-containing protein [Polyangiaceae bacterium]|nr:DUF4230 domain-containing protein [Polyangiaceae bacterium]
MIEPPPPPSRSDDAGPPLTLKGCLKPMGALLAVFSGALLLSVGLLIGRCSEEQNTPAASTTVIKHGPNVVVAVRDLARLEGASFHMERVIDLKEEQSRLDGLVTAADAILLVAAGDVVAGVDLTQMKEGDIQIDEAQKSVTLVLPRATVFSARLDNSRTYVHTRSTDLLAKRRESLETRARQEAERTLEADAVEAGLLPRAEENVARTIETLVRSLGYRDVRVKYARQIEGG